MKAAYTMITKCVQNKGRVLLKIDFETIDENEIMFPLMISAKYFFVIFILFLYCFIYKCMDFY